MVGGLGQFLPHLHVKVELFHLYHPERIHLSNEGKESS